MIPSAKTTVSEETNEELLMRSLNRKLLHESVQCVLHSKSEQRRSPIPETLKTIHVRPNFIDPDPGPRFSVFS